MQRPWFFGVLASLVAAASILLSRKRGPLIPPPSPKQPHGHASSQGRRGGRFGYITPRFRTPEVMGRGSQAVLASRRVSWPDGTRSVALPR